MCEDEKNALPLPLPTTVADDGKEEEDNEEEEDQERKEQKKSVRNSANVESERPSALGDRRARADCGVATDGRRGDAREKEKEE